MTTATPAPVDAQRLQEAQTKIGTALRNAQYALTTNAPNAPSTVLNEAVSAMNGLSAYLTLSGNPIKAAAMAAQIGKFLKVVASQLSKGARAKGSSASMDDSHRNTPTSTVISESAQQCSLAERSSLAASTSFAAVLPTSAQQQMKALLEQIAQLTGERDALQSSLLALRHGNSNNGSGAGGEEGKTERDVSLDFGGESLTAMLEAASSECEALKAELREERIKSSALVDSLRSAEAITKQQETSIASLRKQTQNLEEEVVTREQVEGRKNAEIEALRQSLMNKSKEATSLAATAEAPKGQQSAAPRGYVDKDDFDALRIQNEILQRILQEQAESTARPTKSNAALTAHTLRELEAEHQQQLNAMKLTIHEQYERESESLARIKEQQQKIDDLNRKLATIDDRGWIDKERKGHLEEVDTLKSEREMLRRQLHASENRYEMLTHALGHIDGNTPQSSIRSAGPPRATIQGHNEETSATTSHTNERDGGEEQYDRADMAKSSTLSEQSIEDSITKDDALATRALEQHIARIETFRQEVQTQRERAEQAEAAAAKSAELALNAEELQNKYFEKAAEVGALHQQQKDDQEVYQKEIALLQREKLQCVAKLDEALETERARADAAEGTSEQQQTYAQERVAALEQAAAEKDVRHAELAAQVAQLQEAVGAERARADAAEGTSEQQQTYAQERVAALEQAAAEKDVRHAELAAQVAQLQEAVGAERARADAAESSVEDNKARGLSAEAQLVEKDKEVVALRSAHAEASVTFNVALQEKDAQYQRDLEHMMQTLAEEREHVIKAEGELEAVRSEYEGCIARMREEGVEEREQAVVKAMEAHKVAAAASLAVEAEPVEWLREENRQLTESVEAGKAELAEAEKMKRENAHKLRELGQMVTSRQGEIASLKTELESMQTMCQTAVAEKELLQARLVEAEAAASAAVAAATSAPRLMQVEEELEELRTERDELKVRCMKERTEKEKLTELMRKGDTEPVSAVTPSQMVVTDMSEPEPESQAPVPTTEAAADLKAQVQCLRTENSALAGARDAAYDALKEKRERILELEAALAASQKKGMAASSASFSKGIAVSNGCSNDIGNATVATTAVAAAEDAGEAATEAIAALYRTLSILKQEVEPLVLEMKGRSTSNEDAQRVSEVTARISRELHSVIEGSYSALGAAIETRRVAHERLVRALHLECSVLGKLDAFLRPAAVGDTGSGVRRVTLADIPLLESCAELLGGLAGAAAATASAKTRKSRKTQLTPQKSGSPAPPSHHHGAVLDNEDSLYNYEGVTTTAAAANTHLNITSARRTPSRGYTPQRGIDFRDYPGASSSSRQQYHNWDKNAFEAAKMDLSTVERRRDHRR